MVVGCVVLFVQWVEKIASSVDVDASKSHMIRGSYSVVVEDSGVMPASYRPAGAPSDPLRNLKGVAPPGVSSGSGTVAGSGSAVKSSASASKPVAASTSGESGSGSGTGSGFGAFGGDRGLERVG